MDDYSLFILSPDALQYVSKRCDTSSASLTLALKNSRLSSANKRWFTDGGRRTPPRSACSSERATKNHHRGAAASASISSTPSPTPSSAPSSRCYPPRTAPARRPSPAGGHPYGAPRPSTSSPTVTSLAISVSASRTSPRSSPSTLAQPSASSSPPSANAITARSTAGFVPKPLPTFRSSTLTTTAAKTTCRSRCHRRLHFAPTLRVASFSCCYFPDLSAQSLNFPHLKQLTLHDVTVSALSAHSLNFPHLKQLTISGDALHNMLSGCLSLEILLLEDNVGIARLSISSPTLRSIGFSASYTKGDALFQELAIEDAPCLERQLPLYPDDGPVAVRIIRAPKLQVLGLLSNGISTLHVGTTVFQQMTAISVTTTMRTVKVLAIESVGPNLDAVIGFLKCFPCLERLYVILQLRMEMKNVQKYDPLDPIECLESYLRRVVLENYSGDMPDVEFAKFFVLNAKVLEEMKFVSSDSCDRDWKSNQHMWLQVDSRASPDARLEFMSSCEDALTDCKRTHDLSMADPLERTFNLD